MRKPAANRRIASLLWAAASLVFLSVPVFTADDQTVCNAHAKSDTTEVGLAACSRAIESNAFRGNDLKVLYYNRARRWGETRDAERAFRDYREALRLDPNNIDILDRTFISSLVAGEIDEGASLAASVIRSDRTHRVARLVLGVQALKQKQYQVARQHFAQAGTSQIGDLAKTLLSAWALLGMNDVQGAVKAIDNLNGPDWYRSFKLFHAGLILDLAGRSNEAGSRFEQAHKLDPSLRVVDAYARWASRRGDAQRALTIYDGFEQVISRHPLILWARNQLRSSGVLPALVDSVQLGAAEVLYGLGATLARNGAEDLGIIYLQLAIYFEPGHSLAILALGDVYENVKKPDLALAAYARIPDSSALRRYADIQAATVLNALNRPEEAKKRLQMIIAANGGDFEAFRALGDVFRERKEFSECADAYSRAIASLDRETKLCWFIYYLRGVCYERSQAWEKAEPDLRKALDLSPDQPQVMNYLGHSLVEREKNIDEALQLITRAAEQRPDDGYIIDSLGFAYYRQGRYFEAAMKLERAIELQPNDPSIRTHLGDAYWRLNRRGDAISQWSRARELKPELRELAGIEEKLRVGLPDVAGPPAATVAALPSASPAAVVPANPVRRVALVVGNSAYKSVVPLPNPRGDAELVAAALRGVGFQSVRLETDLGREKLIDVLRAFGREAETADWAVVYFAGHGIEVGGVNYLIPVDARLETDRDLQFEAVALDQVLGSVEAARKLRLVILDACRDNPFARQMRRTVASRSIGRGLGRIEPEGGTLVAYAAKHGEIALDGEGRNSPFVTSLVRRLPMPGIEINKLFRLVRDDVMAATERKQEPFVYGSLPGEDFFFVAGP